MNSSTEAPRKRLCFVNTNTSWGGGEKWHFDVAYRLHEQGGSVVVIAGARSPLAEKLKARGVPVREIAISNWSVINPFKIFTIKRIIKSLRPDIMLLNMPNDVKTFGLQARMLKVPRIIYRRGSAIPIRNTLFNRFVLKRVLSDILVNSEETRRTINQTTSRIFDERRIHVIYNGLKFRLLDQMPEEQLFAKKPGEIVIGNLSRLSQEKAQYMLVEIAERLKSQKQPFKVIIGGEGEKRPYLETLIRDKGLENDVLMPGFIENIRGFMQSIDIFVHPSLWEGFGYVMAEASYFKRPVVAFRISGIPEVVKDGETGLLAKFMDLEGLYQKVLYLINHEQERKRMGEAGFQYVTTHFDFEKNFLQLMEYLYKQ